jgi:Protein of unknown function (DUF2585)
MSLPRSTTSAWLTTVSIVLASVLVLHLMGRVAWCECHGWRLGSWNVNSQHNSQHLLDQYSFSHVLHGVVFFFLLLPLAKKVSLPWRMTIATLIESGWEILENTPMVIDRYRSATASLGYSGDSIANSVADIVCCLAGFELARRIGWKGSLAFFLIVEVVLLLWIRDNLTLNVIMLLYPLKAIRDWQTAG